MRYKIYFGDKPLYLTAEVTRDIEPLMHHDDAVYMDELSTHAIKTIIHEMEQQKIHAGIFLHADPEELKRALWKKFLVIKAGGGLVVNGKNEILMIHRRGKWDLPKGKLDPGETMEECALREVEEETGLQNMTLAGLLETTYHTYHESGKHIMKESYWYEMKVPGSPDLKPQAEEDIHEAKWMGAEQVNGLLSECFPSVKDVLVNYLSSRHDQ